MMETCKFDIAWVGRCNKQPVALGEMCEKHSGKKCTSCGAQATQECAETGQFVCGALLCDDCEHATFPDGYNGGVGFNEQKLPDGVSNRHVKKAEQKYAPWWEQEKKNL